MFKVPTSPVESRTSATTITTRETPAVSDREVEAIRACFAPISASPISGAFSRSLPSRSGDPSMFGAASRLGYEKSELEVPAPTRPSSR